MPCFVIDRRMGASGAQPAETLLGFLREGWSTREPVAIMADGVAEGDACGPDGC
ncbi:hypothetical protein [Baekduia soli]|uniref:hypothetical protein n=1 Tax=Baekduia soli TaxID=496014 RepID=UPI001E493899|nr:hypothetical protein [Baekduia soli]